MPNPNTVPPIDIGDPKLSRLLDSVLRNNEVSSDEELIEYFVEAGIDPATAAHYVSLRDSYIGRI